jgi:hypothetical protein
MLHFIQNNEIQLHFVFGVLMKSCNRIRFSSILVEQMFGPSLHEPNSKLVVSLHLLYRRPKQKFNTDRASDRRTRSTNMGKRIQILVCRSSIICLHPYILLHLGGTR